MCVCVHAYCGWCYLLIIIAGIHFEKSSGQHMLKNPLIINSMIEKVNYVSLQLTSMQYNLFTFVSCVHVRIFTHG